MVNNTFVALATPKMSSAIAIIRVNGEEAYSIVQKIVKKPILKKNNTHQRVYLYDGDEIIDDVVLVKFVAPRSFTGDDLVEINCHGSLIIIDKIINLLIKNGARLAQRGEFTKRAFLNNKINLLQANSINNLINASTNKTVNLALSGLVNKNIDKIEILKNDLFMVLGKIEVNIDYPEYDDVEVINHESFICYLNEINKNLKEMIDNYEQVKSVFKGVDVAIIGKPNVGKSSLLNALLKKERAIISNVAGTTRDTINESILINDIQFNLIDTAGIRESKNKIESIGIKKSFEVSKNADFIIFVIDDSKKISNYEKNILSKLTKKNYVIAKNKSDLSKNANKELEGVNISAKNNNIKSLVEYMVNKFNYDEQLLANNQYISSNQELIKVKEIYAIIKECIKEAKNLIPLDVIVEKLKEAYVNLCELSGESRDFDMLDKLFKNFCLGK